MNGKGDANRTADRESYRKNYGRIFKRRKKMDEADVLRKVIAAAHEQLDRDSKELERLRRENARLQAENEGLRKLPLVDWDWVQED